MFVSHESASFKLEIISEWFWIFEPIPKFSTAQDFQSGIKSKASAKNEFVPKKLN